MFHQVHLFRIEKEELDKEISKWDDSGNDIIVLAKQMCMIMMEMTDFTRGRGPLKNTMHVINAAKKISEAGHSLDTLCKDIANEVRNFYQLSPTVFGYSTMNDANGFDANMTLCLLSVS